MFSLIITIISIALVAVLALATLYYGGDAFNKGSADAQAAKIVNQGQQLLGAAEMFFVDNKTWPTNVQALIDGGYLKSAPVAYQGNGTVAQAWAAAAWQMPVANQPVFVADVDASDTCRAVNKRTVGLNGVLARAHTSLITQCYGTSETSLKAIAAKNTAAMAVVADPTTTVAVAGLLPAADVTAAAAPTGSGSGWLPGHEPTTAVAGGGSSSGSCGFTRLVSAQAPGAQVVTTEGAFLAPLDASGCATSVDGGTSAVPSSSFVEVPFHLSGFGVDGAVLSAVPVLLNTSDSRVSLDTSKDIAAIGPGDGTWNYCNINNYFGSAGCMLALNVDGTGITAPTVARIYVQFTGSFFNGTGTDGWPSAAGAPITWVVPVDVTIQPYSGGGGGGGEEPPMEVN